MHFVSSIPRVECQGEISVKGEEAKWRKAKTLFMKDCDNVTVNAQFKLENNYW